MTLNRIGTYPAQKELEFIPSENGPATPITWDTDAPGYRRIVAAEGDLSGEQPDTVKYLLEITAANGTTSGIARTVKLYTYDVQSGDLQYIHTISGLPNFGLVSRDYATGFFVNVKSGYYTLELGYTLYVIDLVTGTPWGNSGSVGRTAQSLSDIYYTYGFPILPHTNGKDFFFCYTNNSLYSAHRAVTIDPSTKSIASWGTEIWHNSSSRSWPQVITKDTRADAPIDQYLVFQNHYSTNSPLYHFGSFYVMNASTGATGGVFRTNGGNFYLNTSRGLLDETRFILGGYDQSNMTFYSAYTNGSTAVSTGSWGVSGKYGTASLKFYYDTTGNYAPYVTFCDANQDAWFTRAPLGPSCFGNSLFRASDVVPGITVPNAGMQSITPMKYGFFYVGQMNTTGTAAPVIWYTIKPN